MMTTRFFGSVSRFGAETLGETAALMRGRVRRRGLKAVEEGPLVEDLGRRGSSGEARRGGDWRDCMVTEEGKGQRRDDDNEAEGRGTRCGEWDRGRGRASEPASFYLPFFIFFFSIIFSLSICFFFFFL